MNPVLEKRLPLQHASLDVGEKHICTVVLNEVAPEKMFGIFGPTLYQSTQLRYHGHLTNKRLILEVYPYGGLEKIAIKAALTFLKSTAPGVGHARALQNKMATAIMSDSQGKWFAFVLNVVEMSLFEYKVVGVVPAKFFRIRVEGQDKTYGVGPCEGIPNPFTVQKLAEDFTSLCINVSTKLKSS